MAKSDTIERIGAMGFNGLNGTIVFNTTRDGIAVGTVPGEPYGCARPLTVTIEIRAERLQRRETYETIEHETVSEPLGFALTSAVWDPSRTDWIAGGATVEPLREVVERGTVSPRLTSDGLARLADIGERWHLNDVKAGCAHQTVVYEDGEYGRRPSLTLTEPCPMTGYRYGSSWLIEPLPDGLLDEVSDILEWHVSAGGNVYRNY